MPNTFALPGERLLGDQEARAWVACVREAAITDCRIRDQAFRAALGTCLNTGEGAGRSGSADKARVYAIARGEASEAAVALDIAIAGGLCDVAAATAAVEHARRAYALLTGLIRRFGRLV